MNLSDVHFHLEPVTLRAGRVRGIVASTKQKDPNDSRSTEDER